MNINEKAAQIVAAAQVATVASIDENGYPRPVAMVKLKDENGGIYFSTGTSSAKTAHFRANPKAGVSIVEGEDSVVYTGEMEIVTDMKVKQSLWDDWMLPHIPGGVEDPDFCILKFTPKSSTYWIDSVFVKDGKYVNMYCQSCGIPLQDPQYFGTNQDGSANPEYCYYCYKDGAYTEDCTMDGMIEISMEHLKEQNPDLDEKSTLAMLERFFPNLKRWRVKQ